ncbi:MAG: hypothetical protein DRP74_01595 [Candidatus Omnitrophota bacterium]|nr:MAG: hypothetical protein DRP74_01595 [Candidatus Omnitrophota bacterium]
MHNGPERRKFVRLNYVAPLAYKICKAETIKKLLEGYTSNVSQSGILCKLKEHVNKDDIIWLSFDRDTLQICTDLEKNCLVYQSGIIGKVVRIETTKDDAYNVGIQFITRQEKDLTHIHSKLYFIEKAKEEGRKDNA